MTELSGQNGHRLALITGGAGGIGSHLVAGLRGRGWSVRVVDNFCSGARRNLAPFAKDDAVEVRELDILDLPALKSAMAGVDMVWHLAANPDIRRGTHQTDLDLMQGPVATRNVLEAMREARVPKIAFSSSSVVYGHPKVFPTPEDYGPLLPESLYAAGKLGCEGLVSAFVHSFGFQAWIFRFANVVGPGATHGVIFDFLEKLRRDPQRLEVLGDGRQSKGYLWVTDCVDSMLHCVEKSHDPVNVFNLAPEDTISVREIAEMTIALTGSPAKIAYTGGEKGWPGDVPQQRLATDRLHATGYATRYTSRQVVEMAIRALDKELPPARP